uniref:Ig-like domain-containing protein n=1 Tax=Xenopus tropicalis TaxID=8364 RepID=A0A803K2Y4_XENTR
MVMHKLYYVPVGAAVRPVVSFSPNWTPIFPGESVTLSCNVAPTAQGNLGYSWYRDGHQISGDQQSFVIHSSTSSDIGNYQCQVGANERNLENIISLISDWVILQAPPAVYEGDSLSLRCHSRPGFEAGNSIFYKDNKAIGSPVSGSELQIGRVNVTASGTYKCEKEIYYYYRYRSHGAEQHVRVQGKVQLKPMLHSVQRNSKCMGCSEPQTSRTYAKKRKYSRTLRTP